MSSKTYSLKERQSLLKKTLLTFLVIACLISGTIGAIANQLYLSNKYDLEQKTEQSKCNVEKTIH